MILNKKEAVTSATEGISRILNDFIFYSVEDLLRKVPPKMISKCEINAKTGAIQIKTATATEAEDDFKEIARCGSAKDYKIGDEVVSLRTYGIILKGRLSYDFGKALLESCGDTKTIENVEKGARVPFEVLFACGMDELYEELSRVYHLEEVVEGMNGIEFVARLCSAKNIDTVMTLLDSIGYAPTIDNICKSIAEIIFEKPFKVNVISFDEGKPFLLDKDGVPYNPPIQDGFLPLVKKDEVSLYDGKGPNE